MVRPFHIPIELPAEVSIPEILDFGYPQNSEVDTLKSYITTEGVKSELAVVRPAFRSYVLFQTLSLYIL